MKRWIAIIVALILFFSVGYPIITKGYFKVSYLSGTLAFFDITLDDIERRAVCIVAGRVYSDAETVFSIKSDVSLDYGRPLYSVVSLEITKVIKGDLKEGEIIKIIEPYYITGNTLFTFGNYLPSKPEQEYIFFLGKQRERSPSLPERAIGAHSVINLERGRYLVPSDRRSDLHKYSRSDLSLGKLDIDIYMQIYQDVVDAYLK